jgi:hypothetical protein
MEETRKIGSLQKRWKDDIIKNLNMMEIRNRSPMARHRRECRKTVLEATFHNGLFCLGRRGMY